jgi:Mg-chelatase subunit ChlD
MIPIDAARPLDRPVTPSPGRATGDRIVFRTILLLSMLVAAGAAAEESRLNVEIHTPPADLHSTGEAMSMTVEGVASAIGGVKHIDMMMVLDTSMSLRDTDPDNYRGAAAIGLIESLSPKSDINIGIVGFSDRATLLQPLSGDRNRISEAVAGLKRAGGTNLADGIRTALAELTTNGRQDASRVIMLFTDGMSNEEAARQAAREARDQGVAVQTLLLGENLKGGFLLEEIAQLSGGTFVWVLDPAELPEAFLNLKTTGVDKVTLSVNGSAAMPAQLTAGTFSGDVPLTIGENRIAALATGLDGQTRTAEIVVNVMDSSCAALEVAALNEGRPAISVNDRAVEIVVDTSRSMWGQIDGRSKMEIAREILEGATASLPEDLDLALRAYGNESPSEANDCSDSSLLVPFGLTTRTPIFGAIGTLKPRGQTPIAFALNQAAFDFAGLEAEKTLILVTDGLESCGGDPVAAARDLRNQGIVTHIIGFGLGNTADENTSSLKAMAAASGGRYFTANSADELRSALEATVGTSYRVLDHSGVVARGVLGSSGPMVLPVGDYRLEFDSTPAVGLNVSLAGRDQVTVTLTRDQHGIDHTEYRDLLDPEWCRNQDPEGRAVTGTHAGNESPSEVEPSLSAVSPFERRSDTLPR